VGQVPFATIRRISHLSTSDVYAQRAQPSVQWTVLHQQISVQGHSINLNRFANMFEFGVNDALAQLDRLGRGAQMHLQYSVCDIVDDNMCRAFGYSFLSSHNYRMEDMRYHLLEHLCVNGFLNGIADGLPDWNLTEAAKWMNEAQKLNTQILVLM